jgi:hypothetical protein
MFLNIVSRPVLGKNRTMDDVQKYNVCVIHVDNSALSHHVQDRLFYFTHYLSPLYQLEQREG